MKLSSPFLFILPLLLVLTAPAAVRSEEVINEVFLLERHDRLLAFSGVRNNWFEKGRVKNIKGEK